MVWLILAVAAAAVIGLIASAAHYGELAAPADAAAAHRATDDGEPEAVAASH